MSPSQVTTTEATTPLFERASDQILAAYKKHGLHAAVAVFLTQPRTALNNLPPKVAKKIGEHSISLRPIMKALLKDKQYEAGKLYAQLLNATGGKSIHEVYHFEAFGEFAQKVKQCAMAYARNDMTGRDQSSVLKILNNL